MSKKVTKQIIRNNMESFASFVEGASEHKIVAVDKESGESVSVDAGPIVFGAWAMAQYVQAAIDGEVPVESNVVKLTDIVIRTAFAEVMGRMEEGEGDGE